MPVSLTFVVRSTVGLLAVGFAVLFSIIGMTSWLNERARVTFDNEIAARDIRTAAAELRDGLRTAESSQRAYLFIGNEIYLAPYDAAKAGATHHLVALRRLLPSDPTTGRVISRLEAIVADKIVEMDQTIALKGERKDAEALAVFRTNRGKTLMDEANLFLTSIIQGADEKLTVAVSEQRENASLLRWISFAGGMVIIVVMAIVITTVARYTREIKTSQEQISQLNITLEDRVRSRTADLARARDRAEVLLAEVNHRVANSLTLVASLVNLQTRSVKSQDARDALAQTQGRITAISLLHRRLYSSGDARVVSLDEYLSGLLEHLETAMRAEGHTASLKFNIDRLRLGTDAAINLGVVVTEWVTNAFKYAYVDTPGQVRVRLEALTGSEARLSVEDDGIGRVHDAVAKGTGLGTKIVNAMASSINGRIDFPPRERGTLARLTFSVLSDVGGSA